MAHFLKKKTIPRTHLFNLKWWGNHTDHRVTQQEVYYLSALIVGWRVEERHLGTTKLYLEPQYTDCFVTCFDLVALLMLNSKQIYLFGRIQTSETGGVIIYKGLYKEKTEVCVVNWTHLFKIV